MSIQVVSADVAALSDSVKITFQLISRLSKLSFQPGSTPLDEQHGDVRLELAQDIRDSLKQNEDSLETLKQEADHLINVTPAVQRRRDSIKDRERARIAAQVARLEEDLKHARGQFRKAQLTAKRASEAAKQKEREILFASIQQPDQSASGASTPDLFSGRRHHQQKQLTQEEVLVNASSDVTSALRRTHDLLTSELSRSRFAQETLDQSTAALADLGEKYGDLDSLLNSSKNLLGTLVSSQKSDTWYLETAFYILVATICWLIFRRIIYGPASLIWFFIKLSFYPFKLFLAIFTTNTSTANTNTSSTFTRTSLSVSRPPLRVQPSASGKGPKFVMNSDQRQGPGVPVGGGGMGAKKGKDGSFRDPSPPGSLSQKIGQMAEASRQQAQPSEEAPSKETPKDEPAVVRRGDGTILQERGETPRNPKKKQWEEDVESVKHQSRKRDEL